MYKPFAIILVFSALLSGACSKECNEPDIQKINALYFELKKGGEDGFTQEQLDSAFIVRFVPFSQPLIADTMYLYGKYTDGDGRFFINDEFPFLNYQSPYFPTFGYMVVDPLTGFVGTIENIDLKGEYDGDCHYENLDKNFTYNGEPYNYGGSEEYFLITN